MFSTMRILFATLFDRDALLERARELGAVQRVKQLHPADVLLALVQSRVGDEHPSIATARRQYHRLTGFMPEESSFYERLTPGLGALGWELFLKALAGSPRARRRRVAKTLGLRVRDVRAIDATEVTLPGRAAALLPSTDSKLGGFKITAALSLVEDLVLTAQVTDARQHDRKALGSLTDVRRVLHLMDRGYADHSMFADIDDGAGFFIIRLKTSSRPRIESIRSGVAKRHLRKPLAPTVPVFGVVDLDARFRVNRSATRQFRVVGIPVARNKAGKPAWVWLATNLPTDVPAETVGTYYRLRWSIETLFRALKGVGRLDEIESGSPAVIRNFMAAALLALVLSQSICAAMRAERPHCDPSLLRVFQVILVNLTDLRRAYGTPEFEPALERLCRALWREGVNPNPGRPYARERHLATVAA